ncbi:MAG: twin-arginine translocase subunit TatC [Deltaproteobacteria bacterium]|nr:twin-arginine translocase subunit TatC [Deltaproteobacteria bacterium]
MGSDKAEMGILEHLAELRLRLAYALAALTAASVIAYGFAGSLFLLLSAPYFQTFSNTGAQAADLIGTGPAEAFILKIQLSIFAGAILASPVIFYQVWRFISPGLYEHEKKWAVPFLGCSTVLFVGGVLFCYYAVLPIAFDFFNDQYTSIGVKPAVKISEYLSLVIRLLLAFGLVFEIPVLAYFLARFGLIDDQMLLRWVRPAIVVIFIVSAIITPPDVISQFLLAAPLILLYGFSILIAKYANPARRSSEPLEGTD